MTDLPLEPEAFTEFLVVCFRKQIGKRDVEILGPLDLRIDAQTVNVTNLYRAVTHAEADGAAGGQNLVEQFIASFLSARQLRQTPLPLEVVSGKILPRIHPLEAMAGSAANNPLACQPFVNDTVILYAIDLNGASVPITIEQLIRWGVDVEEIDRIARQNLAVHRPRMELRSFQTESATAAVFNTGDGYDASRLLLQQLHTQLSRDLGRTFLVAIPSRDVFIAFPCEPSDFVTRLKKRVEVDYRKLPNPITSDLFLVTLDGVAGSKDAA